MHVRILLQITADDGAASLTEEVTAFEKSAERPEDLGLSLAEGKAVTAAIQRQVVNAQVASWTERHRGCEACGVRRRSKGSSPVVRARLRAPGGSCAGPRVGTQPGDRSSRAGRDRAGGRLHDGCCGRGSERSGCAN